MSEPSNQRTMEPGYSYRNLTPEQEVELHQRCVVLIAALTKRIRELENAAAKSVREEPMLYDGIADPSSALGSMVQGFEGSKP